MPRQTISSGSRFEAEFAYSRAVVEDGWVFVSGTTGYDYATMTIAEDAAAQCEQAFRNIAQALGQAGASMQDVVRVTYLLPDREDWPACAPVIRRWLGDVRPAATMMIAALLSPAMRIEVEVTARLPTIAQER
jgi:enamine deaminase RidA (YjgF/YER057c/UK114 family)